MERPQALTPPRVLFVSPHAKRGGAERYLEVILGELGPEWIAAVICLEEGDLVGRLRNVGICPVVIPTSTHWTGLLRSGWHLRRFVARTRPDVVHANGIKAALVSAVALVGSRVPMIWVKHDFSHDGWVGALVATRTQQVVGVSRAVLERLPRRFRSRLHVVPPGTQIPSVDRERGRRLVAEATGQAGDSDFVALVGRIDPYKGHEEALRLLPSLRIVSPRVHFVFIGGADASHPNHPEMLSRLAAELDVAESVSWLGHRNDVELLLAGCRLVVVPSRGDHRGMGREGFGLVGLEAFAVGTPVVGYAGGALPEVLGDCAILVSPGDRDALGRAIAGVLRDRERWARLADCGGERVRERYTVSATVEGMRMRYREAAERDGNGG